MIAQYKQIRQLVQRGSLYRLVSPLAGSEVSVTESVSPDRSQAVTFAFLHSSQMMYPFPRIYLRGLDEHATYRLKTLDGQVAPGTPDTASGTYWIEHGFDLNLRGDFQAAAFMLERQ
jgi:alpha-galactosidase